jgi:hypothetical protein
LRGIFFPFFFINSFSFFFSFSGNVYTLRGISAQLICMDEMAFVNKDLVELIVLPLFEMKNACLLCISSPQDHDNFYSVMFNAKNPHTGNVFSEGSQSSMYLINSNSGKSYFLTPCARLACDRCIKIEKPEECKHNDDARPWWKDVKKQEIARFLMLKNSRNRYLTESVGLMMQPDNTMIAKQYIEDFKKKEEKPNDMTRTCFRILLTIDPNMGGANETGIVASEYEEGQITILGLDSHAIKNPDEADTFIENFLKALRLHPRGRSAIIIGAFEKNTGLEAGRFARIVKRFPPAYCIRESNDDDYGIWTTAAKKMNYAFRTRDVIMEKRVFFAADWICTNPWLKDSERHAKTLEIFFEQLPRYRIIDPLTTSLLTPARAVVSGKVNSEGKIQRGQNDDLCFTFTFNVGIWWQLVHRMISTVPYERIHL